MSYLEIDNTKLYYETKGEGTPMWLSCEAAELRIILPEFCFIFAVIVVVRNILHTFGVQNLFWRQPESGINSGLLCATSC
jgi:hypothetical protein